jgi:hypothetical protein
MTEKRGGYPVAKDVLKLKENAEGSGSACTSDAEVVENLLERMRSGEILPNIKRLDRGAEE